MGRITGKSGSDERCHRLGGGSGTEDNHRPCLNKSFNPERLVGSGGMPSSHSATVCGMTTAAALHYGVGSFEFAVCFILSMVVMYDAMGVRRETGKQAKLLNSILLENPLKLSGEVLQEKLKEYVGHTPLQVAAGAILGIALAVFMAQYY